MVTQVKLTVTVMPFEKREGEKKKESQWSHFTNQTISLDIFSVSVQLWMV